MKRETRNDRLQRPRYCFPNDFIEPQSLSSIDRTVPTTTLLWDPEARDRLIDI